MKKIILAGLFNAILLFSGCTKTATKKSSTPPSNTPFSFTDLKASANPVQQGKVSNITATASGSNLSYQWTASHGDLLGSGAAIMYGAPACCVGTHTITCVVSDGSASQTKTLLITVTQ